MARTSFDGSEIVSALTRFDYRIVARRGSHVKLRLERDDLDSTRIVTVPLTSRDDISQQTYRSIAEQCGASDFHEWCRWIDEHR